MNGEFLANLAAMLALTALALRLVWRAFRPRASAWDHPAVFFLVVCCCLLALRLPQIRWAHELNVDESQMLAQGMRYLAHPVPWRDVDGTTSGPLNSMLLSGALQLGAPATWSTARCTLWAANCLTLIFVYLAMRCFGTRAEAQFTLIPVMLFYAFARDPDFTHYSSETLSVVLLSVIIYLVARGWTGGRFSSSGHFLVGLICGAIPFAKLQAAPLALFLIAVDFAAVWRGQSRRTLWRPAAMLYAGAVIAPALILGTVLANGALGDFWKSYILASGHYIQETPWRRVRHLGFLFLSNSGFRPFFACTLAAGAMSVAAWRRRRVVSAGELFWPMVVIIGLGAATTLCLLTAGKTYWHHALLLVPGMAMFIGLCYLAGRSRLGNSATTGNAPGDPFSRYWLAGFVVLVVALQLAVVPLRIVQSWDSSRNEAPMMKSVVAASILRIQQPGDTLWVWGWMPSYYIETGRMPATRDAIGHYVISAGPYQEYFRQRSLADLEKSRPPIFVDAVGGGVFRWDWTEVDRHESFPELARFIDDNYSLWLSIQFTNRAKSGAPIRIYVVKDRMEKLRLTNSILTAPADPLYPAL